MNGREWIGERFGNERAGKVAHFLDLVIEENARQNLIAPSTVATIWERHALDSAQLLRFDRPDTLWIDVGTGGGFPGLIVAILRDGPVTLVEPRARRAAFLSHCVDVLQLAHVEVIAAKIECVQDRIAGVLSARAVASMDALVTGAAGCTDRQTRWVLPRGQSGEQELAAFRRTWHGTFHVEHSLVDPSSTIILLDRVRRR